MSVLRRHEQFTLESRKSRPGNVLAHDVAVIATYTVDSSYVTALELADNTTKKILPLGYVVALHPETKRIVPHHSSYGFEQLGVTLYDVDCGWEASSYDREIEVIWRGDVLEENCWDNGTYGTVLNATKATLADRIGFVKVSSGGAKGFIGSASFRTGIRP